MIACRTRHDLSSASSMMAGRRLSDRSSMSITIKNVNKDVHVVCRSSHTTVDRFEFADNIQANFGELIFQEMKE